MSNNTTGHTGVYKRGNGWYVQISIKGKNKQVGKTNCYELACLIADEARDLYHGKYARINRVKN